MSFRCAHIADIHFRGLSRHDQYRAVFQKFFDQMQKEKPDVIFVGGDIVHSKTQGISPELIDVLNWWFRGLSKSAKEVHVILGNHDGLILNDERLDTISPIVSALELDNVFLQRAESTRLLQKHRRKLPFLVASLPSACLPMSGLGDPSVI